jgi:calcium-dependent protein kinase
VAVNSYVHVFYFRLCGYPPFYGDTDNQIFDSVRTGRFDFPSPDWDGISDSAKDFIRSMLKRDPTKRSTAAESLNHPWIQEMTMSTRARRNLRSSIVFSKKSITFKKYRGMQKLQKAALTWIATNVTNDEVTQLRDVFKKIDTNNDGTITLEELDECIKAAHFLPGLTSDLTELRQDLSLSGEDSLKWREFIASMIDTSQVMKEDNIRMVFEHFKKDDRDYLLLSDIADLVGGEKHAKEILKAVDDNNDGKIDFNEFRRMMEEEDAA